MLTPVLPGQMMEQNNNYIRGKIIKLSEQGWGFISSTELKFTRIFFHWSGLNQNTLKFPELKVGMMVEFIPIQYKEQGWRAIKINVVTKGHTERHNDTGHSVAGNTI